MKLSVMKTSDGVGAPFFRQREGHTRKMNDFLFYHKLGADNFFIEACFGKPQYFPRTTEKTVFLGYRQIFNGKGAIDAKIKYSPHYHKLDAEYLFFKVLFGKP